MTDRTTEVAVAAPDGVSDKHQVEQSGKRRRWVSGRRALVLLCVSGVSFTIMLDSNIVAVSLPPIARGLGATFTDIEWVVSAYVLTFAALLMAAGALADRFGRRRLLLAGIAIFTTASALCGLAPTASVLNAARALQGAGAAAQLSAALAILGHEFRGADRARAFGFWGTVIGAAICAGPPVGGLVTTLFGWRWVFLINVPVGVALIGLGAATVQESRDPAASRLDIGGMVTFGLGLFCLVWAMIGANADGWSSRATILRLGAGVVLLVLFIFVEHVQRRPMVDFSLLGRRTFLGSACAMLGFAAAAQVMMTYLPLYLQNVQGMNAAIAGLAMLPFALPLLFCPRIAAWLATILSGRTLLTLGLMVVTGGDLATAWAVSREAGYPVLAAGMFLIGCGAGLLNGETTKVSMSVVPPERGGMASGMAATVRFVGLVTGIAGLGAVLTASTMQHFARVATKAGLSAFAGDKAQAPVSHLIAGDLTSIVSSLPGPLQTSILAVSRLSFAFGFTNLMLGAAGIGLAACIMTFALVSADETAPHSRSLPNAPSLPENLD
jgi:EmrB/QacA subfamily drug resistance transporter